MADEPRAESLLLAPLLFGAAGWAMFGLLIAVSLGSFIGVALAVAGSACIIRWSRRANQMGWEFREAAFQIFVFYVRALPKYP